MRDTKTYSQLADVNTGSRTVGGEQLPVPPNRLVRRGEANFLGGQKDGSLEGTTYHGAPTSGEGGGKYWRPQNREGRGRDNHRIICQGDLSTGINFSVSFAPITIITPFARNKWNYRRRPMYDYFFANSS